MVPYAFLAACQQNGYLPLDTKFKFNGVDELAKVDIASLILRRVRSANSMSVTFSNTENQWDYLHASGDNLRANVGILYWTIYPSLWIWNTYDWDEAVWETSDWEIFMVGNLEEYNFDEERRNVVFKFTDKLPEFIDIEIGSTAVPEDWTAADSTIPVILLHLLTTHAGLVMGTDIDATTWGEFDTQFNRVAQYPVRAYWTGENLSNILDAIEDLTGWQIFFGKDRKLYFAIRLGGIDIQVTDLGAQTFKPDETNILSEPGISLDLSEMVNYCELWTKNEPPPASTWDPVPIVASDGTSITNYGYKKKIIKDAGIWAMSAVGNFWSIVANFWVDNYKYPREKIRFDVNLYGFLASPQNRIFFKQGIIHRTPYDTEIGSSIDRITYDFMNGKVGIETTVPTW